MAFPFSPHLIIHARLAKPCRHKKGEGGGKPWFFVSATHATLIAYWLSLLTTCWPQKQIPLAAVHLSGARERREHSENSKGNSGMGGERERGGKNVLVKPRCLRRRGSLMWHIQNSADKQGSGPLLLLIKGAVVLRHHSAPSISRSKGSQLQRACSKLCGSLFKDLPACSLFFPHG